MKIDSLRDCDDGVVRWIQLLDYAPRIHPQRVGPTAAGVLTLLLLLLHSYTCSPQLKLITPLKYFYGKDDAADLFNSEAFVHDRIFFIIENRIRLTGKSSGTKISLWASWKWLHGKAMNTLFNVPDVIIGLEGISQIPFKGGNLSLYTASIGTSPVGG